MPDSRYLIVGGGMAADAAVRGIREIDGEGSITLISAEPEPPYKRPPLSKGLWNGTSPDRIWSGTGKLGVHLRLGRTVLELDPGARRLVDDQGTSYAFDKLLLATGVVPRYLSPDHSGEIIYFRTVQDYRRLRLLADRHERFAVIGGGFIGSEIAAALAASGKHVTMVFPGDAIGDSVFPFDLALSLNDAYRDRGVEVLAGEEVVGVETWGQRKVLRTRIPGETAEREVTVDGIVAGIGTRPNIDLARAAGIDVSDGIVVDEFLRTSHPDIYAAGDVANFWISALRERRRVEHEDNAKAMGRAAGRSMAGQPEPYHHLPFFYSDLFDLGYEAVGDLDPRMETVADWTEPYRKGIVYYLRDDLVRGVLLWNVWDKVEAARDLIGHPMPVERIAG